MTRGAVAELVGSHRLARAATAAGLSGEVNQCSVEQLPCVLTNMTTEELARIRFAGPQGASSLIVKIARSPRHSPLWAQIPLPFRDQVMDELPWRAEPDLYRSDLAALLPPGMRMPTVYRVDELEDDRVALWMEDVEEVPGGWSRQDYRTAARMLGRLSGRLPEALVPAGVPVQRRDLRNYFFGRVVEGALPGLRDETTWAHPLIAAAADPGLREDLELLAAAAPALLGRLERLPYMFAHGDACPQNLLRPVHEPNTVVAIDWTFAGISPIGMDAGQLLAGHAESGDLDPRELPGLFDEIVSAYTRGLIDEGAEVDAAVVRFGAIGNLVVRSAFTALPLELLESPAPGVDQLFASRARYARFLVDLAEEVDPA